MNRSLAWIQIRSRDLRAAFHGFAVDCVLFAVHVVGDDGAVGGEYFDPQWCGTAVVHFTSHLFGDVEPHLFGDGIPTAVADRDDVFGAVGFDEDDVCGVGWSGQPVEGGDEVVVGSVVVGVAVLPVDQNP